MRLTLSFDQLYRGAGGISISILIINIVHSPMLKIRKIRERSAGTLSYRIFLKKEKIVSKEARK